MSNQTMLPPSDEQLPKTSEHEHDQPAAEAPPAVEHSDLPEASPRAPRTSRAPKGLLIRSDRQVRLHRAGVLAITVIPLAFVGVAAVLAWGEGLSWVDLGIAAVFYLMTTLGTTIGYHRLLTHASFETKPWAQAMWASFGSLAVGGDPLTWVADHRRHHAYSDTQHDPHSPVSGDDHDHDDFRSIMRGLWHAHMGWLLNRKVQSDPERWAPDLLANPTIMRISRAFPLFVAASFVLPALAGGLITGSWYGAFTAFVWAGMVRMFLVHHVTWSINSICHTFGTRTYRSNDHSTNNWVLSLFSMGESWHNNHHAFPSSAVHGLDKRQVDISAGIIRGMEKVGLAWNVKVPSEDARERRRIADSDEH